jgi:hypothetical protein
MTNKPLTEQDFEYVGSFSFLKEKVQSAKRGILIDIDTRLHHIEFMPDRENVGYCLALKDALDIINKWLKIDACFQISDGDDKK